MLGLKLSDSKKPLVSETRTKTPQEVVLEGIQHQIGLLKDGHYTVKRTRYVKDEESAKLVKKEVVITPRPWFWKADDGLFNVQLKYGTSHVIELEPNKPTITAGKTPQDVIKVLETVVEGVKAGKLDAVINATSEKAKRQKKAA